MTDSIYYQARNKGLNQRYITLLNGTKEPVDNRSGDEIAADVITRMGLKFDNEGSGGDGDKSI